MPASHRQPPRPPRAPDTAGHLEARIGGTRPQEPADRRARRASSSMPSGVQPPHGRRRRRGRGQVDQRSTGAAQDQLQRAEYIALDDAWRPVPWGPEAPRERHHRLAAPDCTPLDFDAMARADCRPSTARLAAQDCLLVAEPHPRRSRGHALGLARAQIEQAGLRARIQYRHALCAARPSRAPSPPNSRRSGSAPSGAADARHGVSPALDEADRPERAGAGTGPRRARAPAPIAVVMAGRLLGFLPDLETAWRRSLGTQPRHRRLLEPAADLPLARHFRGLALGPERRSSASTARRDGRDIARMLLAGASAVGIASPVMLRGPQACCGDALRRVPDLSREPRTTVAADLIGRARRAAARLRRNAAAPRQLAQLRAPRHRITGAERHDRDPRHELDNVRIERPAARARSTCTPTADPSLLPRTRSTISRVVARRRRRPAMAAILLQGSLLSDDADRLI